MEDATEYYSIDLRFVHPSMDSQVITDLLDTDPDFSWKSGEQAKTPKSDPLKFIRKQSYWVFGVQNKGKDFSTEIHKIIGLLTQHRDFVGKITTEGGAVEIYLGFVGSKNVGSTPKPVTPAQLGDLGITLSIEVYPKMNHQERMPAPWDNSPVEQGA
jgi:hypothetical protein